MTDMNVQAAQLPVEKLRPFEGHPFKVNDDAEMEQLIQSIRTQGFLTPISVRPIENNEYEDALRIFERMDTYKDSQTMIKECKIPIAYVDFLPECDVLLTVDCQYGEANVENFPAKQVMIIDHHIRTVEEKEEYLVKSDS